MEVGSELEFSIEFDGPARKLLLECTAEIVRVESSGRKLGVAAHIKEPRLGYLRQEKQQKANSTQGERI
jgi:acyl-coenzyme A thioesterase PaaI-like protein